MANISLRFLLVWLFVCGVTSGPIPLPSFRELTTNYPGYKHHGGLYRNHHLVDMIGCKTDQLLHDTSALRLSSALNKIGSQHSLGKQLIHLSKFGKDSVIGRDGFQYIYHPIAYGPYLADKYGYPSVSKLHQKDPEITKRTFWGKQGILRVITYKKHSNVPVGHVALWDCTHFYQSKDWIEHHSLITVEFWESPDSKCNSMPDTGTKNTEEAYRLPLDGHKRLPIPNNKPSTAVKTDTSLPTSNGQSASVNMMKNQSESSVMHQRPQIITNHHKTTSHEIDKQKLLHNSSYRRKFIKAYFVSNGHLRHAKHRGLAGYEKTKN